MRLAFNMSPLTLACVHRGTTPRQLCQRCERRGRVACIGSSIGGGGSSVCSLAGHVRASPGCSRAGELCPL